MQLDLPEQRSDRTETEELLLRAVHWFADAELQRNPENRVQSYVTCFDMFFSTREGGVTAAVQDGVAFFMGHDRDSRVRIHRFVGEAYDSRSRASHEGSALDLPGTIVALEQLVVNSIAEMLRRRDELPDKKAIKDCVFQQRMS